MAQVAHADAAATSQLVVQRATSQEGASTCEEEPADFGPLPRGAATEGL